MEYAQGRKIAAWGCLLLGLALCQAATHSVSGDVLDETAVGKARCEDGKNQQLKPFLVEWDATDLAQFEALTVRNLVFVKYEGCALTVLDGCLDDAVPGRYGSYQPPQFTSGTVETVRIQNEDELYAKLPLGAASFGGRVKLGEELDLQYYVTGVATSTRGEMSSAALARNPRCAEATHYVHQYHLGAFRLGTKKSTEAEGSAEVGDLGGGGNTRSRTEKLKEGGDIESCTTHQQLRCRVPIRVVLRPLDAGGPASADLASPPPPATGTSGQDSPQMLGHQLRNSARSKEKLGDGVGCLQDLERADRVDPQEAKNPPWLFLRAYCQMAAGQCEQGKQSYREFLTATDQDRELTEEEIAKQVQSAANAKCPSSTGKTDEERIIRAIRAIAVATKQNPPNVPVCLDEVKQNAKLIRPRLEPSNDTPGTSIVERATFCLVKAGRCDEAERMWARYYELNWPKLPQAERHQAATMTFSRLGCKAAK